MTCTTPNTCEKPPGSCVDGVCVYQAAAAYAPCTINGVSSYCNGSKQCIIIEGAPRAAATALLPETMQKSQPMRLAEPQINQQCMPADKCAGKTCTSPSTCQVSPGTCSQLEGQCSYAAAPPGTPCGNGGTCDSNQNCITGERLIFVLIVHDWPVTSCGVRHRAANTCF